MKERQVIEYPEALISCACTVLVNSKILNVMVRILFDKTNVYEFNTVQETFNVLNRMFTTVHQLKKSLAHTFDYAFFYLGIKICLEDEAALNIAKCLWFIYYQYHMFYGALRKDIIYDLLCKKNFKRFFFHWSRDVRSMFQHLLRYRVLSLNKITFENKEESLQINLKIKQKVKTTLKELAEDQLKSEQKTYFKIAFEEYARVEREYKKWTKNIPTASGKLYGVSDTFPYPEINPKLNFLDLSERRMEEQW